MLPSAVPYRKLIEMIEKKKKATLQQLIDHVRSEVIGWDNLGEAFAVDAALSTAQLALSSDDETAIDAAITSLRNWLEHLIAGRA